MQHALIAVFDNRSDAQSAMDELLLSGFSREDVRLTEDTTSIDESAGADTTEDEGIGTRIKHFFSDLFGTDNDMHSHKYSTAVSKGHHVLTVIAPDEPEVERAADIVERFGPVDIDEKAAEWGSAYTPGQESMRMSGAGGMQQSQSTELHFQGDRNLFAQQSLNDERPMGQTYQESMGPGEELSTGRFGNTQGESLTGSLQRDTSMGTSGTEETGSGAAASNQPQLSARQREVQRRGVRVFSPHTTEQSNMAMDDETYYRSHWQVTYSASGNDYDEYAPAYSYGYEMASVYRGRPWNDAESDVRQEWESRGSSAGPSTWNKFKDAIRHGWNRLAH